MIDPTTFATDIVLEISCSDDDQILSRPIADGYTYEDLAGKHVRFSGPDETMGAVPEDVWGHPDLTTRGWCECAQLFLTAKTYEGATVNLGAYYSADCLEAAKAAIAASINP
jgi:hypothetical protein